MYNNKWSKADLKLVVSHFYAALVITETKSYWVKTKGRREGETETLIFTQSLYNVLLFLIISLPAIIYLYNTCLTNLIQHWFEALRS